jgi:hypothetical protein
VGHGPVYFCFANPAGFSGQKAATELVIKGLTRRKWTCRRLAQPVLERGEGVLNALPRYLVALLVAWIRALFHLMTKGFICVELGQTRASFVRDSVPLLLGWARLGRKRVVVSLHGSLFMNWAERSFDVRAFRFLLNRAGTITVLGERQRARLIDLGLPDHRVVIVVNSCEVEPATAEEVAAKHQLERVPGQTVRLLHLGSLIDTKGFPEYLEALLRISRLDGPNIDAVLCGPLAASQFSSRFSSLLSAEAWIDQQIAAINSSPRVHSRWIKGAVGVEKTSLFREADIFVLPTRYPVEAQPLVLLEAMASGCAIITTRIGEIPTILDDQSAVFIAEPVNNALAPVLQVLIGNAQARSRLAAAAHSRFVAQYGIERHIDQWEMLLEASESETRGAA